MIDVNIRPLVIRDPDAYRARLGRLLSRCHVVKASDDDLRWLEPDRDEVEAARALLEAGPAVVLLARRRARRGRTELAVLGEREDGVHGDLHLSAGAAPRMTEVNMHADLAPASSSARAASSGSRSGSSHARSSSLAFTTCVRGQQPPDPRPVRWPGRRSPAGGR